MAWNLKELRSILSNFFNAMYTVNMTKLDNKSILIFKECNSLKQFSNIKIFSPNGYIKIPIIQEGSTNSTVEQPFQTNSTNFGYYNSTDNGYYNDTEYEIFDAAVKFQ